MADPQNAEAIDYFLKGADFVTKEIAKDRENLKTEIDVIVKKHSTPFWQNILIGVISSFAFALIIIAGAFIFKKMGNPLIPSGDQPTTQIVGDARNPEFLKQQKIKMDSLKNAVIDSIEKSRLPKNRGK